MTCAFLGAGAGSWLGTRAYTHFGWTAVCALVALAAALPLTTHLTNGRTRAADHDAPAPATHQPQRTATRRR